MGGHGLGLLVLRIQDLAIDVLEALLLDVLGVRRLVGSVRVLNYGADGTPREGGALTALGAGTVTLAESDAIALGASRQASTPEFTSPSAMPCLPR